jgi:hypothetical protein
MELRELKIEHRTFLVSNTGEIYENNKELSLEKQSRKGSQNGKARKIELLDEDNNHIKFFEYIGECCEYIIKEKKLNKTVEYIRSKIYLYHKKGLSYLGYKFNKQ